MRTQKKYTYSFFVVGVSFIILAASYYSYSRHRISDLSTLDLVHYAVVTESLCKYEYICIPSAHEVILKELASRPNENIVSSFSEEGLNATMLINLVKLGRPSMEYGTGRYWRAERVAFLLKEKGLSKNLLSRNGCSALHSIVATDNQVARDFLIDLFGATGWPANPQSDYEHCRLPIEVLLERKKQSEKRDRGSTESNKGVFGSA